MCRWVFNKGSRGPFYRSPSCMDFCVVPSAPVFYPTNSRCFSFSKLSWALSGFPYSVLQSRKCLQAVCWGTFSAHVISFKDCHPALTVFQCLKAAVSYILIRFSVYYRRAIFKAVNPTREDVPTVYHCYFLVVVLEIKICTLKLS